MGDTLACSGFCTELLSLPSFHLRPGNSSLLLLLKLGCSFARTRTLELRLQGGGNGVSLTSWMPRFSFSISSIEHYCSVLRKKLQRFIRFPGDGNLPSFGQISNKSFLAAKRNVWLRCARGGEPAVLSAAGGGVSALRWGPCWPRVRQQRFGGRECAGLYLALGAAKRSTKTPCCKQGVRRQFSRSQPAPRARRPFPPSGDGEGGEGRFVHSPKCVLKGFEITKEQFSPIVRLGLRNQEVYVASKPYENVINLLRS